MRFSVYIVWPFELTEYFETTQNISSEKHFYTKMPAICAASHVDHDKRVVWFSISMHACGSVVVVMGLCLVALRAA